MSVRLRSDLGAHSAPAGSMAALLPTVEQPSDDAAGTQEMHVLVIQPLSEIVNASASEQQRKR